MSPFRIKASVIVTPEWCCPFPLGRRAVAFLAALESATVGVGHSAIREGVRLPPIMRSASSIESSPASTFARICRIIPSDRACELVGVGHRGGAVEVSLPGDDPNALAEVRGSNVGSG